MSVSIYTYMFKYTKCICNIYILWIYIYTKYVVHVSCTHYRVRFVLRRGNVSNRRCSHSTRLRRPASASPLKRKIPLSRRTEGWNPGPSFHQLSHLFLEFCAALFSSLVPFDHSSISLHYLCICCWCFAVPTFCTIYPCRSLPKVVLEYFRRHSSYLQVTNNTNTIQKRHENNTNNDEHGCNTNVLIPLMFHQFVP